MNRISASGQREIRARLTNRGIPTVPKHASGSPKSIISQDYNLNSLSNGIFRKPVRHLLWN